MEAHNASNFIRLVDPAEGLGSSAHIDLAVRVKQMLTSPRSQGGLGLSQAQYDGIISSAAESTCRMLYNKNLSATLVGEEFFWLMIWQRIYASYGKCSRWSVGYLTCANRFGRSQSQTASFRGKTSSSRLIRTLTVPGPPCMLRTTNVSRMPGLTISSVARLMDSRKALPRSTLAVRRCRLWRHPSARPSLALHRRPPSWPRLLSQPQESPWLLRLPRRRR